MQVSKSFQPTVSSHGYGDANIYFLAGFPSKDDLLNGVALSGYAENTLNSFLSTERLKVKQTYRATFIKQQLEYSGSNPKKLSMALAKVDTEKYLELLFQEIKDVNPNVVVPLDDLALSAVFPHITQIKKPKGRMFWINCYRGSILPLRHDFQSQLSDIVRVIPTFGPQILNVDFTSRAYVALDYKRIYDNRLKRGPIEEVGKVWVARTYQELSNYFDRAIQTNDGYVTFDIETFCGVITCCSFCFDGKEAVSVPLNPFFYPHVNKTDMALNWILIGKLMKRDIPKCGQNVKYDWTITERHGIRSANVIHDTMLKASLLYPELPKGLDFLTSLYTDIPYYKDEGKNFDPAKDNKDRLLLYNAKDSLATHIISKKQDAELEETGQKELYFNEVAPLLLIYKDIDETGILIDDAQKQALLFKYNQMYSSNISILRGLVGNAGFNPASPMQVGKLVYDELRFPKRMKTDENGQRKYKTDKDTLDDLVINYGADGNKQGKLGVQLLNRLILCRKLLLILNYINTPLHPGSVFKGVSNLGGTETGRTSFSKSLDEAFFSDEEMETRAALKKAYRTQTRLGRSLQTITKHGFRIDDELFDDPDSAIIASDLRTMFIPRRGFMFVEGDGSQAEARAVAVLAEDWELLESFDKKPKIHAKTAALCFGGDPNLITKDAPRHPAIGIALYDLGKRIRHAGHLGIEEFRLSQMTHLPIVDTRIILVKFHEGNPKIRGVFHHEVQQFVTKNRFLRTPHGRVRQFFERISNHLIKEALSQLPQSTISDQTKFSMPRIREQLSGYGTHYRFLTEQHDGILAEVRKDYWEKYAMAFKEIYERPISFLNCSLSRDFELRIPCELSKSEDTWKDLEEFKL